MNLNGMIETAKVNEFLAISRGKEYGPSKIVYGPFLFAENNVSICLNSFLSVGD